MDLTKIKRPTSDCGIPFIKLVTVSECNDKISDSYYGTGTVVGGSNGMSTQAFPFQKITNLKGFVSRAPREIVRQVSLNCRAQKASSNKPFVVQGGELYPVWKMTEIEDQFHAKHIYIDGNEVVFRGGTIFKEYRNKCTGQFTLEATVEECTRSQIYGCTDCTSKSTVIRIPDDIVTDTFFNDNGIKIASSFDTLLAWYRNQTGVTDVADISAEVQIACDFYKVFRVQGTGAVPNQLYYDAPTPDNKIYGHRIDNANPDYSVLCGGIDNTACAQVLINPPEVYELTCDSIVIGIPEVYVVGALCNVFSYPNWQEAGGSMGIVSNDPQRSLSLSLFSPDYVLPTNPDGGTYTHTMADENLCQLITTIPADAVVTEVQIDEVALDPLRWHFDRGMLNFDPCLKVGDRITAKFGVTAPPVLSGQIIAQISGTNCAPTTLRQFTHNQYDQIPEGATLIIEPNGNIKWVGPMTTTTSEGSTIEVTNIVYNL